MTTTDQTCLRVVRHDSRAASRPTVRELSTGIAVSLLWFIGNVALLCLLVEYGASAYSLLRDLFASAAHHVAVLLHSYWLGIGLCASSSGLTAWSGLVATYHAVGKGRRSRLLLAIACIASLTFAVSAQSLLELIGSDASVTRWAALIATHFFGILACAVGLLAGFGALESLLVREEAHARNQEEV